ncbi:MAG: CoA-binding protein [Burkholderiales bacterium]
MDKIKQFFTSAAYAVVGATNNRAKFGNKVLRCYLEHNKTVYPVHPQEKFIEDIACIASVSELPDEVASISIVTPPAVTEQIVDQAIAKGITNIWLQPGAESALAVQKCQQAEINVIANGPCILVHSS